MTELTADAWFEYLEAYELVIVSAAIERALAASPSYVPTAPFVKEHCIAMAKTSLGVRPNLELRALPEPEAELPVDHPMHAEFEAIKAAVREGQLHGPAIARAFVNLIARGAA